MDINVLMIAVLLFIPIYLMGVVSNSKVLTIILAGILLLVAIVFMGEKYIFFDVVGIGIVLFFAFMRAKN